MIYDSYTIGEGYYEFVKGENSFLIPSSQVILVDDESGLLSIKCVGSRKTIALVRPNE